MGSGRPTQAPDNPRLTDSTLLSEAMALAAAADAYTARGRFEHSPLTIQFMLGRAIELALKAFLVMKGATEADLRRRSMGHDLENLWKACEALSLVVPESAENRDAAAVSLMNAYYRDKLFEYPQVQGYRIVPSAMARRLLHRLIGSVFVEMWGEARYRWESQLDRAEFNGIRIASDAQYAEPRDQSDFAS